MTLGEIYQNHSVGEDGVLRVRGKEIALVYYRIGYQLEQYSDEGAWKTRELMDTSMAIKLPSINVHLATFKKF